MKLVCVFETYKLPFMKRLFTIVLCLASFYTVLNAQPLNSVSGLVKDSNHQPLSNIMVHISSTPCGAAVVETDTVLTDANGYYSLDYFHCIDSRIDLIAYCPDGTYSQFFNFTDNKTTASLNFTCGYDGTTCEIDFQFFPEAPEPGSNAYRMRFEGQSLNAVPYRFTWNFGDVSWGEGNTTTHDYNEPGNYTVCADAYDGDTPVCTVCKDVVVGQDPNCRIDFSFRPKANADGSVTYRYEYSAIASSEFNNLQWQSNGNAIGSGQNGSYDFNAAGTYTLCLIATDAAGLECERCKDIVVTENPPPCVDHTRINPHAQCPDNIQPVCGCDGVTYESGCVAENYYGITAWTPGSCQGYTCGVSFNYYRDLRPDGTLNDSIAFVAHNDTDEAFTYEWKFGDNRFGGGEVTTHTYANEGVYQVCLEAFDANGTLRCIECRDIAIGGNSPGNDCFIDFTHYPDQNPDGSINNRIRFEPYVSQANAPYTYNWTFGEGNVSNNEIAIHEYAAPGVYQVCLTTYDANGVQCNICREVYIEEQPGCPVDYYHYEIPEEAGDSTARIRFDVFGDTLAGFQYIWNLDDGNMVESMEPFLNYDFQLGKLYRVCMEVRDGENIECLICRDVDLRGDLGCGVDFTHFREIRPDGTLSSFVNFEAHNLSEEDYTYQWYFGNLRGADGPSVSTEYDNPGTYNVCVAVYDLNGTIVCEICRDIVIDDTPPPCIDPNRINDEAHCPDVFDPVCGCDGVTYSNACEAESRGLTHWTHGLCPNEQCEVDFTYSGMATASGYVLDVSAFTTREAEFTYRWKFGDGNHMTGQNANNHYVTPGVYTICVEAFVDDLYVCTICKDVVIGEDGVRECVEVDRIDNTIICPEVYDPVCGCDRITYANACIAEYQHGVTSWTTGECPTYDCPADFTFYNEPLNDGSPSNKIRFEAFSTDNGDYAYRWNFGDGTFGAGEVAHREYVHRGTYTVCVDIYSNETYICTICKDVVIGDNPGLCFDESLINNNTNCPDVYDPVCGCDGVTYDNSCVAENRYGITSWTSGPCDRGCQIAFDYYPDTTVTTGDSLFHNYYFNAWTLDGHSDEYTYKWSFGDGQTAESQVMYHSYTAAGTYTVCVEAWKGDQYICSWCSEVVIHPNDNPDEDCRLAFGAYPNGRSADGGYEYKLEAWTLDGHSDAYTYVWHYGDDQTGTGQGVIHNYTAGGYYYVCVEAYDGDRFVCSWCTEVRVVEEGEGDCHIGIDYFKYETTTTDPYYWYEFKAGTFNGTGNEYAYQWDFGDGRTGYGKDLRHNYTRGGVYTVCVTAIHENGTECIICTEVVIDDTPDEGCRLSYNYYPVTDAAGSTIPVYEFNTWTLDGNGEQYNYRWDFGDGRKGSGSDIRHEYTSAGVYKACVEAYIGDHFVCSWCNEIEIEELPDQGCRLALGYAPDTTKNDDLIWYLFDAWDVDGNNNGYTYKWDFGNGQSMAGASVSSSFTAVGSYRVCFDAYDGETLVCSRCDDIRIERPLPDDGCQIGFEYYQYPELNNPFYFEFAGGSLDGNHNQYTYKWNLGNGNTSSGTSFEHTFADYGVYKVCIEAYKGDEFVCSWCDEIKIEDEREWYPCDLDVEAFYENLAVSLRVTNDFEKYYWDFGDGNFASERSVTHTYTEPGNYFICLETVDREGNHCSECRMITVTKEEEPYDDPCIDESKIDLSIACTEEVKPVCGCDGVEYRNSCVAENYYGVKEWKEGSCERDEPGDELVICDVDFEYSVFKLSDTIYLIEFFTPQDEDAYYFWDFGDGQVSDARHPIHYYNVAAGEDFAMTACLYVIRQNIDGTATEPTYCVGQACETLVIDDAQDAFIEGRITSGGDGLRSGVVRRSGDGEPLASVKVQLIDVLGQVIGLDTTDEQGQYQFDGLLFGNYRVQVKIDGIDHDPYPVKLDPLNQDEENLDFEVTEDAISTSTDEVAFAKNITLYPNPTNGQVQLEFDLKETTQLKVEVTNLFGQTLRSEELDYNAGTQKINLDLSEFASGVYMITLSTDEERVSRRVIRQE